MEVTHKLKYKSASYITKMHYNIFMVTPWQALLIKYVMFWDLSTSKLVCSRQLLSSALQNQRITPCLRWPSSVADLRHLCDCPPHLRDGRFFPTAKSLSPPTHILATGWGRFKHWRCEISQKMHYNIFMVTPWQALLIKYVMFWDLSTSKLVCSRQLLSSALQNQRITPCLRWPSSVADLRHLCDCPPHLRDGRFYPTAKSLSPPTHIFATGWGCLKHWRCAISQKIAHDPNVGSNSVRFNSVSHKQLRIPIIPVQFGDRPASQTSEQRGSIHPPPWVLGWHCALHFSACFAVSYPNPAVENRMVIQY